MQRDSAASSAVLPADIMERSSILMVASLALYLLSLVEVSSLAFVPGSHQGAGNIQLRGAADAGARHHAGTVEPLVGQSACCLRVAAAALAVSAASLSMRGSSPAQSCTARQATKTKEDTRTLKEKMAGRAPYAEKIEGMVPMEKINAKFRQMKYDGIQHWQIKADALAALKDGPVKKQVTARYKAMTLAMFGKVQVAGAFTKNHPPSFFAQMVMEAAKAENEETAVSKDLFELGKQLTSGLEDKVKKLFENAAGDNELVQALMKPIGSENKVVKSLITFLLSKGRLAQLKDICLEFSILSFMEAKIIPVTVKSQAKLTAAQKKKLEAALSDGLGSQPDNLKIDYETDPAILAGVQIAFDFDDPINKENPRRKYDFDFRNVVSKALSREFGV